jgi:hypothetical protein
VRYAIPSHRKLFDKAAASLGIVSRRVGC